MHIRIYIYVHICIHIHTKPSTLVLDHRCHEAGGGFGRRSSLPPRHLVEFQCSCFRAVFATFPITRLRTALSSVALMPSEWPRGFAVKQPTHWVVAVTPPLFPCINVNLVYSSNSVFESFGVVWTARVQRGHGPHAAVKALSCGKVGCHGRIRPVPKGLSAPAWCRATCHDGPGGACNVRSWPALNEPSTTHHRPNVFSSCACTLIEASILSRRSCSYRYDSCLFDTNNTLPPLPTPPPF